LDVVTTVRTYIDGSMTARMRILSFFAGGSLGALALAACDRGAGRMVDSSPPDYAHVRVGDNWKYAYTGSDNRQGWVRYTVVDSRAVSAESTVYDVREEIYAEHTIMNGTNNGSLKDTVLEYHVGRFGLTRLPVRDTMPDSAVFFATDQYADYRHLGLPDSLCRAGSVSLRCSPFVAVGYHPCTAPSSHGCLPMHRPGYSSKFITSAIFSPGWGMLRHRREDSSMFGVSWEWTLLSRNGKTAPVLTSP
jgi:hypothetical protein